MKKSIIVSLVIGLVLAVWGFSSNNVEDEKVLVRILKVILETNHYSDQTIDDDFSKKIYQTYLNRLDFNKMYFLQEDIDALKKYELQIDNELSDEKLDFYYASQKVFGERLKEAEIYCNEILSTPFDFSKDEDYETDSDKRDYSKTKGELRDYWRMYLKYMTLNSYLSRLEKQQKVDTAASDSAQAEIKSNVELEKESREQVQKSIKARFKRRFEVDDEDNFSIYVNSIAGSFGPHTQYFPPQQKENFDLRMTGTLEGIGAVLQQEEEYIKVSSIVIGSASWKQGELKAGDLILKVAQKDAEPVDIVDAPMKEVLKLIRGKKGTEVRLTVQKPDGDIVVIPIVRDVVVREETYAKSATFENKESGNKFGYIYLPSFYSKFGKQDGRNSADDVKRELELLKSKRIDGIVLDLRDNGGGSLNDAVKMAGLFFEEGPVVQVKDKVRPPQSKVDYNSEVTYDGTVVVLTNFFSASASEILAGALKDYNRAVIVGSPSTYGKGTVQTFIDLNGYVKYVDVNLKLQKPFGALKYTVQQFYRVNGSSTQFKGVRPHIVLPDLYTANDIGEKELDYALPWDSINKTIYTNWEDGEYDINELVAKSNERVSHTPIFNAVTERVDKIKNENKNSSVSLNEDMAMKKRKERKERNDALDALRSVDDNVLITSLQDFKNEEDSVASAKRATWESQLSKDAYIREAMNVLKDMLPKPEIDYHREVTRSRER